MKERFQGIITGILISALSAGGVAIAKSSIENIEVTYDNIKIYMDGELVEPKDANGQTVEPFIYDGTTYLPVRAVGNAIGKEVNWDGVEKVVYLGAKPGNVENWLDVCGPYLYNRGEEYRLTDNKYFTMSGKKYTNGFILDPRNKKGEACFNLNGEYNSVTFTAGHIDETHPNVGTLNVYIDGIISYTTELRYDDVAKQITIPLNGALQMKFEMIDNTYNINKGNYSYWGFSEGKFERGGE